MRRTLQTLALLLVAPAAALLAGQHVPPAQTPEGFVPAGSLPQVEQLPAAPLVIAAYAFVWVALLAYLWLLWRRMTRIEGELADLRRRAQLR